MVFHKDIGQTSWNPSDNSGGFFYFPALKIDQKSITWQIVIFTGNE